MVELTEYTSYGYDVIDFARDVLGMPLDPWQEWLVIHAGELLPDGRPRFRVVLVLVARQQGKSHLARVLTLYWLYVERVSLVLGLNATRDYAKVQWQMVCNTAQAIDDLSRELPRTAIRKTIGEECLTVGPDSRPDRQRLYRFAAANRRAGRSLTIDRIIADELREHATWDAWNAAYNAMNARPYAQLLAITNQGDDQGVVLDALRGPALDYCETGQGDPRLGIFEWSAPDGSDPTDLEALAHACPDLGRRTDPDALLGSAVRAVAAGGVELASFRTEVMCMRVTNLDPVIDPDAWRACVGELVDLAQHRRALAACVDVAMDGSHATLLVAALVDGMVHVDVVAAWQGYGCVAAVRRELPDLIEQVRPRQLGWFPQGPAASLAVDLTPRTSAQQARWPPRGTKLVTITAELTAVCMALPELVAAGQVVHAGDPMVTAHVESARRLKRGDAWVYQRAGAGPIDGVYALAGVVHLARAMPPGLVPLRAAPPKTE